MSVAEAAAVLADAGFIVPEWRVHTTGGVDLPCELHVDGEELFSFARDLSCSIVGDDRRGDCLAQIAWPGQVGTQRRFADPVDAAKWLVAMLRRFGIPSPLLAAEDVKERLEAAARVLQAAGFRADRFERGGREIVGGVWVDARDRGVAGRTFGVFAEPSGGYYVATKWPGYIVDDSVCMMPEDVLAWIASFG